MTDIDRIDQMRLRPGDTIEMRREFPNGNWYEDRRTLLWHGEEVAVWAIQSRYNQRPKWSDPYESASPVGNYGDWRKVEL